MNLDRSAFLIHDVSAFPIVRSQRDGMQPGFAAQWQVEMDDLLAGAEPFVIIFEQDQLEEAHEDRKARGLWLKRNKQALVGMCIAVIAIEPDAVTRVLREAQSALATRAFGITSKVVGSEDDAVRVAGELLQLAAGR